MLHSRKFEVIDKICKMHSINLKNTEFRVQTALGTSRRYYKHSIPSLIHDTSQSSGSSETHLVFISVPMTNTLEKQNNGCTIIGPDKKYKVKKTIIGFVDDKRQYANDWKSNSLLIPINKLQTAAHSWEHLLYTSSDKL